MAGAGGHADRMAEWEYGKPVSEEPPPPCRTCKSFDDRRMKSWVAEDFSDVIDQGILKNRHIAREHGLS